MIEDEGQFNEFLCWLPELMNDEVYFISLSARNKYLTVEEREYYGLGRTEMFSRTVAYDKDGLRYAMEKLRASLSYRRTRLGKEIPEKSLVTYVNVNPSSMLSAYAEFKQQMDKELNEMLLGKLRGKDPDFRSWHRLERHLMNCVQRARARRLIVDVDVDTTDRVVVDKFCMFLDEHDITHRTVKTQGGFHVLVDKSTLKKTNIYDVIKKLDKECEGEVCINKNAMVPVPGTLQAGKLVTFI